MTEIGTNTKKQVPTSPEIRAPTIHGSEDLGQWVRIPLPAPQNQFREIGELSHAK
jgi:hypothetical protein